jgi:hypothetical protein
MSDSSNVRSSSWEWTSQHLYEVRPRKDHHGVDLISDALPFGRLWYGEPNAVSNAIGYAMHRSRSHDAVIRVFDAAGNPVWDSSKTISRHAVKLTESPRHTAPINRRFFPPLQFPRPWASPFGIC